MTRSQEVQFYPYPFPTDWINETVNGTILNFNLLFPNYVLYNPSGPTWGPCNTTEDANIKEIQGYKLIQTKAADFATTFDGCSDADDSGKSTRCVMRYGRGYLVQVSSK